MNSYTSAVTSLLTGAPLNELGPGRPNETARKQLDSLTPESLAAPHQVSDRPMAMACIAGLWLRHDFLDESHKISQEIENSTGSFWHAIVHRREGDFANSKYWWRRVGRHEVFGSLGTAAKELSRDSPAANEASCLTSQPAWDPYLFVDLCETALEGPAALGRLCREIQLREWELLFDHSYRLAVAAA